MCRLSSVGKFLLVHTSCAQEEFLCLKQVCWNKQKEPGTVVSEQIFHHRIRRSLGNITAKKESLCCVLLGIQVADLYHQMFRHRQLKTDKHIKFDILILIN